MHVDIDARKHKQQGTKATLTEKQLQGNATRPDSAGIQLADYTLSSYRDDLDRLKKFMTQLPSDSDDSSGSAHLDSITSGCQTTGTRLCEWIVKQAHML